MTTWWWEVLALTVVSLILHVAAVEYCDRTRLENAYWVVPGKLLVDLVIWIAWYAGG